VLTEYKLPSNVEVQHGADLGKMLEEGDIDAGVGVVTSEGSTAIKPLFHDSKTLEAAWYNKTGVYPSSHVLVLRDELIAANPELPKKVFDVFNAAKAQLMAKIDSGEELEPADNALSSIRNLVGSDPIPYGLEENRPMVEMALRQGLQQHFTSKLFSIEELFDHSTLDLK